MLDFHKSERVEQYGSLQMIRYMIDSWVISMLHELGVDIYRLNLYCRAVNQLIGHRKKRHKWGYSAFKTMTEDEFKKWWLEYWTRQGLNRDVLEMLYEGVKRWLPHLRTQTQELGERLKKIRQRLAKWL